MKLDYRLELLCCVIYLSGVAEEGFFSGEQNAYTELMDSRFEAYRNHPAVTEYPLLWESGLSWGNVPFLAVNLTDDINLIDNEDITDGFFAYCLDPEGNQFGIIQPDMQMQ